MKRNYVAYTLFFLLSGISITNSNAENANKPAGTGSRLVAESFYSDTSSNHAGAYTCTDSFHYLYPSSATNKYSEMKFEHRRFKNDEWSGVDYFSYNADGSLTEYVRNMFNAKTLAYDSFLMSRNVYDAAGFVISSVSWFYDPVLKTWFSGTRITLTRDANNNVLDSTYQYWKSDSSKWSDEDVRRTVFFRDTLGNIIQQTYKIGYFGVWQNIDSIVSTYNRWGTTLTEQLKYIFCYGWTLSTRSTYEWDNDDRLQEKTDYYWVSGGFGWAVSERITYSYDTAGNNIQRLFERWQQYPGGGKLGYYYPIKKDSIVYNSYNQPTAEIKFNASGGYWIPSVADYCHFYHYEPYTYTESTTSTAEKAVVDSKLQLSPNPAKDAINISLKWDESQAIVGTVSDVAGRVYQTFSAPSAQVWNATLSLRDLPAGNYLISARGSKGGTAAQMISVIR